MSRDLGELRRILGVATGAAVCVGSAVGAGILRSPGEVARLLPDGGWILGVWVLGALVATFDVLILAEMSSSFPRVGGLVAYLHLSFGPSVAFVSGWTMLLITWPGSIAAVAVATGELLSSDAATGRAIAVGAIALLGTLNLLGLRFGARFEVALTAVKVLALAGVFGAALFAGAPAAASAPVEAPAMPSGLFPLVAASAAAMVSVIFTYDGYADAVYMAGETREPQRAIPRALFVSLATITGLYLLANLAFLNGLGAARLARSEFPAVDLLNAAFGSRGAAVLKGAALLVLLGAINSYFLTGPRIARLMAEERLALPSFGRVGAGGTPAGATLWLMVVSIALSLSNTFGELLDYTVPIIWATGLCVAVGLLVQRRRAPDRPRPFRVPAAPLVVGAQVALGLAFFANLWSFNPKAFLVDAGVVAAGFAIYSVTAKDPVRRG